MIILAPDPIETYRRDLPTVDAGPDQTVERLSLVTLAGAVSTELCPRCGTVTYVWRQISGTTQTLSNPAILGPTFTASAVGVDVFGLYADDGMRRGQDSVAITVIGLLIVNAGPDQTVNDGITVSLAGSATGDGSITTLWTKLTGPGTATFGDAANLTSDVNFSIPGVYVLKLTATSPTNMKSDTMQVTVAAILNVDAGDDQTVVITDGASLAGTATGSGSITVAWSKTSGPGTAVFTAPTNVNTDVTFSMPGTYVLRLTATSPYLVHFDSLSVVVEAVLIVDAGPDFYVQSGSPGMTNGVITGGGVGLMSLWTLAAGSGTATFTPPNIAVTPVYFSVDGQYQLTLSASDAIQSDADDVIASVYPLLTVDAGPDFNATDGVPVALAGSSTGGNGSVIFGWTQISGPGTAVFGDDTSLTSDVTFPVAGNYVLHLTAADGIQSASDNVGATSRIPLVPNAGPDQTHLFSAGAITLAGSVTGSGAITTLWSKTSGPGTVTFSNAASLTSTATFSVEGVYVLTLTATNGPQTASDDMTATETNPDGALPYTQLIQPPDGFLYGLTRRGGSGGAGGNQGALFRSTLSGTVLTIHGFDNTVDGSNPVCATLAIDGSNNLYGTTFSGIASAGPGTLFKAGLDGSLTTLYSLDTSVVGPHASSLCMGSDGNLYGITTQGGANDKGTIFQITPTGTFTPLYNFPNGGLGGPACLPNSALVAVGDIFYGTLQGGGVHNFGGVYSVTQSGTVTVLNDTASSATFQGYQTTAGYTDQTFIRAADGNLYGWIALNPGSILKFDTTTNTVTTLYAFSGSDGRNPNGLIEANDGNFYGVTVFGGASEYGTIFKLTHGGVQTLLHEFVNTDGANPYANLFQANDGNLYGTTSAGGAHAFGVLFSITLSGTFTVLHHFSGS